MLADVPPQLWVPPKPAIVRAWPQLAHRFHVNGEDCGSCLPRDFTEMPRALRWALRPDEIRAYLPTEYRLLSDDMLLTVFANIGGLPGVVMAGGIKKSWLYAGSNTFIVPSDWNNGDNLVHAVGWGGNGNTGLQSPGVPGNYYGGTAGGGGAYSARSNEVLVRGASQGIAVNTTGTGFATVLAFGGQPGGAISGGSGTGGTGGPAGSGTGDVRTSGGAGGSISGAFFGGASGAGAGGAGGPHGNGVAGAATGGAGDAGYGGAGGLFGQDGGSGTSGASGGFAPGDDNNAGSGGGGAGGDYTGNRNGRSGGAYGGGGGGGASAAAGNGFAGAGQGGCLLIINNVSL